MSPQINSTPEDCGCHKKPSVSSKAASALRLEYRSTPLESQELIYQLKTKLAELYTQVEIAFSGPVDPNDPEALSKAIQRSEDLREAQKHLQLASYYITHGLTV